MKGSVENIRLMAQKFHYIDLGIPGPFFRDQSFFSAGDSIFHGLFHKPVAVLWIKPVSRPQALSFWQPGPDLKTAICRGEFTICIEPSACIFPGSVFTYAAPYAEQSVFDVNLIRNVILKFVVLAGLPYQDIPFDGIEMLPVKFVLPDHFPVVI